MEDTRSLLNSSSQKDGGEELLMYLVQAAIRFSFVASRVSGVAIVSAMYMRVFMMKRMQNGTRRELSFLRMTEQPNMHTIDEKM